MTVPCLPGIEVESYVPLAQDEVQHWVPGLTTEDKKMITSGGWLSDQIVDASQKLLKSMYPHIQGLQEVALAKEKSGFEGFADKAWCDYCCKPFVKVNSTLLRHLQRHHRKELREFGGEQ
ncbi:hypothetical protein EMCRGX_G029910 [Ephydatia muelleri]